MSHVSKSAEQNAVQNKKKPFK